PRLVYEKHTNAAPCQYLPSLSSTLPSAEDFRPIARADVSLRTVASFVQSILATSTKRPIKLASPNIRSRVVIVRAPRPVFPSANRSGARERRPAACQ